MVVRACDAISDGCRLRSGGGDGGGGKGGGSKGGGGDGGGGDGGGGESDMAGGVPDEGPPEQ